MRLIVHSISVKLPEFRLGQSWCPLGCLDLFGLNLFIGFCRNGRYLLYLDVCRLGHKTQPAPDLTAQDTYGSHQDAKRPYGVAWMYSDSLNMSL